MAISDPNTQAAVDEVRKTKETAARLANGEYPEDADHIRVLAGMIQKLAEQIERLAGSGATAGEPTPSDVGSRVGREAEDGSRGGPDATGCPGRPDERRT